MYAENNEIRMNHQAMVYLGKSYAFSELETKINEIFKV